MTKIFISYRSLDSAKVDSIASKLRAMEDGNRNPLYSVWQDKYNIPDGHNWWDAIVDAIIDCDIFVFMVSEEACNSPICQAELRYAFTRNCPIVPIALEGEYFYDPKTAKNDIHFWDSVPTELIERQAQFLFYEGGGFANRLANAIHKFKSAPHRWQDKEAKRPIDPRDKDDEESDDIFDIYDEAVDFAYRMEFQTAERHFLRLMNSTDDTFQEEADKWVDILRAYKDIKKFASRKSTQHRVKKAWVKYLKDYFPVEFIDGIYDPFGVVEMSAEQPVREELRSAPTQPDPVRVEQPTPSYDESERAKQPTPPMDEFVRDLFRSLPRKPKFALPQPFAWIDIPNKNYSISKYPITNAQFAKFILADGYKNKKWWTKQGWEQRNKKGWTEPRYWDNSKWNGANHPVVGVSWFESVAFCLWLSEAIGDNIMLPTEDQCLYAAQGDDGRTYPWGNDWNRDLCNNDVGQEGVGKTTPVTQYEGKGDSPFGVVDMSGNVWEWCLTDYENNTNNLTNNSNSREGRGGSWTNNEPDYFHCALFGGNDPVGREDFLGFRVSRS